MSTVCYCGHPDCPVTAMNRDACLRNLRARAEKAEQSARCLMMLASTDADGFLPLFARAAVSAGDLEKCRGLAENHRDFVRGLQEAMATNGARAEMAEAQLAEACERLDEFDSHPTVADGIQAMRLRMIEHHARAEKAEARAEDLKDEVARRDALIRSDGYEEMRRHAQELAVRAEKAEAKVKELEAYARLADADAMGEETRADELLERAEKAEARVRDLNTVLHLEREAHDRALRESLDPVVRAKMMESPPPFLLAPADELAVRAEKAEAKVKELEAEIDDLINFSIG